MTNSSHYSLNELTDAVSKGDIARIVRVVNGLKKEDAAPPLLLWGLTEQARKIVETKPNYTVARNLQKDVQRLSANHQKSTDVISKIDKSNVSDLLKQCARVDRVIKGRAYGEPWRELLQLSIATRISV